VIEELSHAQKRGAKIYAEIAGYSTMCDVSAAEGKGRNGSARADCMRRALGDGGLTPDDVDYISACGLGSGENDRIEAEAIKDLLGDRAAAVPVSSIKSMIGHLGAGAGSVELIACGLALNNDAIPPTLNCDNPDEGFDLDFVANKAREKDIDVVLSNATSFAGQTATIAIRKFTG